MARIFGITLPNERRVDYSLTLVYGVGWPLSQKVLTQTQIKPETRVKELTDADIKLLTEAIEKLVSVEGDLREQVAGNIKRLREIGSYRGARHAHGLPVHGQRTKSNARTKKGKRKTVGALKKEAWAKLEQNKTAAPAAKGGKK